MARIFLSIIGVLYIALSLWCAALPEKTSNSVGFELRPGSGQSEFLTVYGGLQFALGILFLWPMFRPTESWFPLVTCCVVHGGLVLFRTISFLLYSGISTTTMIFAGIEWGVFILSAILLAKHS
ncbi:MAG: DUF4345 family protein [Pirellulaceae bacterium]